MRLPRIKRVETPTVYHCTSHLVHEASRLTDVEREFFVDRMRKLARFTGMFIIDYSVMSNHFHIVLESPEPGVLSDETLLARLVDFYGDESAQAEVFKSLIGGSAKLRAQLVKQYLKRMGDVSVFMKELKEGFSRWYNRCHERRGTLWSARFGSEIVEKTPSVIRIVAGYVDLNAVRAWIVDDPKEYRFCGYGAAVAGVEDARLGLSSFLRPGAWRDQAAEYRAFLFGAAGRSTHSSKRTLNQEAIEKVGREGGELSLPELLRLKVRYFTDGVVLGSAIFVDEVWTRFRKPYQPSRGSGARKMTGRVWDGLCTMRALKKRVMEPSQRRED